MLLCGDQDLVTWLSEENIFYDRFPFGEPPIAGVPGWATKEVHFTSYPDPLARAKSFMGHEGFLREYKSYRYCRCRAIQTGTRSPESVWLRRKHIQKQAHRL